MNAEQAYALRMAALKEYADEQLQAAKDGPDATEHLREARAAYARRLQLQEQTRRSNDG